MLDTILSGAELFFILKNRCLHILYVYVLGHGAVFSIRMRSLWYWPWTARSNDWYFF